VSDPGDLCGICDGRHAYGGCPTLVRQLGAVDRSSDLEPPPADAGTLVGATIKDYELVSVLGVGAFGTVYRARHLPSGDAVAFKVLHPHLVRDQEEVQRFVGEARATLMVSHPNVVQVRAIDLYGENRYYIVLELLEGETLQQRCERGAMSFEEAAPLLRQICDVLGAAHAVGVVHRDLKPDNIYLARREQRVVAKVMDFGVARRSHLSHGEVRAQAGQLIGTPQYLSPEASWGLEVDARSDVYSLGVIMFRMLTGRLPFEDTDANSLLHAHRAAAPPAPSSMLGSIAPQVDAIVLRALQKEPAARFASMEALEDAIAQVQRSLEAARPSHHGARAFLRSIDAVPLDRLYELFDVPDGAAPELIRTAADQLRRRIEELSAGAPDDLLARLETVGQRIAAAETLLLDPRRRAVWDAAHGNFLGVAREISRGFDLKLLAALREEFVAEHPALLQARALPADDAAGLARMLRDDPLNIELHRRYWPLRHALLKQQPVA